MSDQNISGGAGMPDSWQRLWAPHRMSYLEGENRPLPGNEIPCPFCRITKLSDEEALIVARGKEAYVVMNLSIQRRPPSNLYKSTCSRVARFICYRTQ